MTNAEREALRDFIVKAARGEAQKAVADAMKYKGVWQPTWQYVRGDVVTRGGLLWHCNAAGGTREKPGTSTAFTMMFKSE
jgi:hypothetical protein